MESIKRILNIAHLKMTALMAILTTVGFFGILTVILFVGIPETNKDAFNVLLGTLTTAWIAVITYYFGSSLGNDTKKGTSDEV